VADHPEQMLVYFTTGEVPESKLAALAAETARACPVDHGTGWRSQIKIEATSMVPRQT